MEASKPKRKHKKKLKEKSTKTTEKDEVTEDSKGDACNDLTKTEASTAGESSGTACVSETLADDSAKSNLPGLIAENDSVIESSKNEIDIQRSDENSTSNVQGRDDLTEDAEKRENKLSFHPQVEVELDRNSTKSENNGEDLHRDTSGNLNTIQLDSTAQEKNDDDSDFKSDSNKTEIPPVDEIQTVDQNKTSDVSANVMKTENGDARSVTEIPKEPRMVQHASKNTIASASGENVATEEDKNVPSQVISDRQVKASQMYPKLDSLASEAVSSIRHYRTTLEAFSEDHLKTFYFNPLLEQMEGFVEHFLRISKQDDHEFYELVSAYFRGRNALAVAIKEYEILLAECKKKKDQLWITKDFTVAAQGKCQDQVNVTHNHTYQQVEMNQSIPKEIDNILDKLHKALHETLALQKYTCQLARLHVDMYIYDMLRNSSILSGVTTDTLITERLMLATWFKDGGEEEKATLLLRTT